MKIKKKEYQQIFPSPGDLPNSGIEPRSLALQADSLPTEPPGKLKRSKEEKEMMFLIKIAIFHINVELHYLGLYSCYITLLCVFEHII